MNCKEVIFLSVMFLMVPTWIGTIWTHFLKIQGRVDRILHAWVLGFATILGMSQLILVPLVALEQSLTTACSVWLFGLQVLSVIAFVLFLQREHEFEEKKKKENAWCALFAVLAGVLIFMQAYIPARYEHSDDDDSRFVAEQVSAVVHDTMYEESPIDADFMFWDEGEVRKDLTSPWAMFMAINAKLSGIEPAVLSHSYIPFFLILLCYGVYTLIGRALFANDWEKTYMFLIVLSVIHLAGYTSTHSLGAMLLLRIWQGKAMCASFMIPLMMYVFYRIMDKEYNRVWMLTLYVISIGACLLSGVGILTAPIMLCLYGILDFCYHKKWRKTLAIWMAAVPCAIFFVYYLM